MKRKRDELRGKESRRQRRKQLPKRRLRKEKLKKRQQRRKLMKKQGKPQREKFAPVRILYLVLHLRNVKLP